MGRHAADDPPQTGDKIAYILMGLFFVGLVSLLVLSG